MLDSAWLPHTLKLPVRRSLHCWAHRLPSWPPENGLHADRAGRRALAEVAYLDAAGVSGWKLRAGSPVVTRALDGEPGRCGCSSSPEAQVSRLGLSHVDLGMDQVHTAGWGGTGGGGMRQGWLRAALALGPALLTLTSLP